MNNQLKSNIKDFINIMYNNDNAFKDLVIDMKNKNINNVYEVILKAVDETEHRFYNNIGKILRYYYGLHDETKVKYYYFNDEDYPDYKKEHYCSPWTDYILNRLEPYKEPNCLIKKIEPCQKLDLYDIEHILKCRSIYKQDINRIQPYFKQSLMYQILLNMNVFDENENIFIYITSDEALKKALIKNNCFTLRDTLNITNIVNRPGFGEITISRLIKYLKGMGYKDCLTIKDYEKYINHQQQLDALKEMFKYRTKLNTNFNWETNLEDPNYEENQDDGFNMIEIERLVFDIFPFDPIYVRLYKTTNNKYCASIEIYKPGNVDMLENKDIYSQNSNMSLQEFKNIFNNFTEHDDKNELKMQIEHYIDNMIQKSYISILSYVKRK